MNEPAPRSLPLSLADGPVYLDYNATTPVDPRVLDVVVPILAGSFGNPSSAHAFGRASRETLDRGREAVAALVGAAAGDVVFTSSGTEANLLALRGAVLASTGGRTHIVTQVTEHPAVLETCRALQRHHGVRAVVLPVDQDGLVDPAQLDRALADVPDGAALVSIMTANNETGALQPIVDLVQVARRHGALVHSDAAQAAGKIPLDVESLGVDLLTLVGHKMYAPKGVAALYVRRGVDLEPVAYGGGQERGLRAGTENVALAAGFGAAAEIAAADLADGEVDRLTGLRDSLQRGLEARLPGRVVLNGPVTSRLPNTLNVSIDGVRAPELLPLVASVATSTGSACHSGSDVPSEVLTAMGIDASRALGAIRLSLGRWTSAADVETAVDALAGAVG